MMITVERLRELLRYDPQTGIFVWKVDRGNQKSGTRAGYVHKNGYRYVRLDGRDHRENRLAWLYVNGEGPDGQVEHRDLDRANNQWANLRLATNAQNSANRSRHRNNQSGYKGVHRSRGKWRARIVVDGKSVHLGLFDAPEEAHVAYAQAADDKFGEFARAA